MLGGLTVTSVVGIVRSVAFYSYKGIFIAIKFSRAT